MPIDRRSLLKATALALAPSVWLRPSPSASAASSRVIVIGAGIAGLAAAQKLVRQGIQVIVLEGRDRIGGRLWSDRSLGLPLDMGASWIHGLRGNPITHLARTYSLPLTRWDYDNDRTFDLTGHDGRAMDRFEALAEELETYVRRHWSSAGETSVAKAVEEISNLPPGIMLSTAEIRFLMTTMFELEYAADADELSLIGAIEGEGFDGPDAILPGGYDQLAFAMAEGLDIRLRATVEEIRYSKSGVSVQTGADTFEADYAVLTLPLGVLKAEAVAFAPELPDAKRQAIEKLGMGTLNKTYLTFPEVFWNAETLNFNRISQTPESFAYWINLFPATQTAALGALNAGRYARKLETMTGDEHLDVALQALRTMFGSDVPAPMGSKTSNWFSDPFAHGSYSFLPVGTAPTERAALAAPVMDTLFFAGEAVHQDHPSTVHGAYLSGLEAAENVLSLIN